MLFWGVVGLGSYGPEMHGLEPDFAGPQALEEGGLRRRGGGGGGGGLLVSSEDLGALLPERGDWGWTGVVGEEAEAYAGGHGGW